MHFDSAVKFGLVELRSGLQTKKGDLVQSVTRPKTVRIFYFDGEGRRIKGSSTVCNLDDTPKFQKCGSVDLPSVKTIKVRVLAVYGKIGRSSPSGSQKSSRANGSEPGGAEAPPESTETSSGRLTPSPARMRSYFCLARAAAAASPAFS